MADKVKGVEIDPVREKLIKLLCDGTAKTETCDLHQDCATAKGDCGFCTIMADHLIANGVTVQEWIPVTERLPDSCKCVLIYTENGVTEGSYSAYNKSWVQFRWNAKDIKVTHWMPLPEPPKGE